VAWQDKHFLTASIPVARLGVHIRRLVSQGYKVGVVQQTETAALKSVGSNKNAPFTRKLTRLYTKATLIDEQDQDDEGVSDLQTFIAILHHQGDKTYLAAVDPATGEIVHDIFADDSLRTELDARLAVLSPIEVLVSSTFLEILPWLHRYAKGQQCKALRIETIDLTPKPSEPDWIEALQTNPSSYIF
jgi:DNA mismatch repair protein MSH3